MTPIHIDSAIKLSAKALFAPAFIFYKQAQESSDSKIEF